MKTTMAFLVFFALVFAVGMMVGESLDNPFDATSPSPQPVTAVTSQRVLAGSGEGMTLVIHIKQ